MGVFCGIAAVVVERGAPQKTGVRHHAGRRGADFFRVAAGGAACFWGDSQIAGIHEFDEFGRFFEPFCIRAFGQCGTVFETWIAWLDVGFFFGGVVLGRVWRCARGDGDGRIAAVAIGAA